MMKFASVLAATLSLCVVPALASTPPNPADYTEMVHVSSSELIPSGAAVPTQQLQVIVSGKGYELAGVARMAEVHGIGGIHPGVLPVGDYKAKLITHPNFRPAYLLFLTYEFLLPDGKTADFSVIGQSE